MIHGWRRAAVLVALAGVTVPAAAQVRGIPVDNSGVPRGIGIHATVGFPNDDAGGGTGYGLTGKVGFGALGVTGMISTSDPDAGDAEISLGGTLNYRVFGGPLVPLTVTLQAGAGWVQAEGSDVLLPPPDVTTWHFPVGAGFTLLQIVMRSEPEIRAVNSSIQDGQIAAERMTRELRQAFAVNSATPNSVSVDTYLQQSTSCAGPGGTTETARAASTALRSRARRSGLLLPLLLTRP